VRRPKSEAPVTSDPIERCAASATSCLKCLNEGSKSVRDGTAKHGACVWCSSEQPVGRRCKPHSVEGDGLLGASSCGLDVSGERSYHTQCPVQAPVIDEATDPSSLPGSLSNGASVPRAPPGAADPALGQGATLVSSLLIATACLATILFCCSVAVCVRFAMRLASRGVGRSTMRVGSGDDEEEAGAPAPHRGLSHGANGSEPDDAPDLHLGGSGVGFFGRLLSGFAGGGAGFQMTTPLASFDDASGRVGTTELTAAKSGLTREAADDDWLFSPAAPPESPALQTGSRLIPAVGVLGQGLGAGGAGGGSVHVALPGGRVRSSSAHRIRADHEVVSSSGSAVVTPAQLRPPPAATPMTMPTRRDGEGGDNDEAWGSEWGTAPTATPPPPPPALAVHAPQLRVGPAPQPVPPPPVSAPPPPPSPLPTLPAVGGGVGSGAKAIIFDDFGFDDDL